jgi:outer membrane protein assembly factor BamD
MRPISRFASCWTLTALLAGAGVGCGFNADETKPITYSLTAKQNYEKGMAALKDESFPEALRYFQFVKSKFPFSKYAVMAELAIADTYFARATYTEAAEAYKSFIRLHPTHEKVENGYAHYKVAESYYKDMPDDVFILPPSYEKDQAAVGDALREVDEFLKRYPDSPYVKDGQKVKREVLGRLVDHEVYVARFYLDHDHPKAAARRLEAAVSQYPGSGREPGLLFALGQTYLSLKDVPRAKEAFSRVVEEYKETDEARRSGLYLDFIRERYGALPAAPAPANATTTVSPG